MAKNSRFHCRLYSSEEPDSPEASLIERPGTMNWASRNIAGFIPAIIASIILVDGCGYSPHVVPTELLDDMPSNNELRSVANRRKEQELQLAPVSSSVAFRNGEARITRLHLNEHCPLRVVLKYKLAIPSVAISLSYIKDGGNVGSAMILPDRIGSTEHTFNVETLPKPDCKGKMLIRLLANNANIYEEELEVVD